MTAKQRSWFASPLDEPGRRSLAERFAIPHAFPPDLSLPEVLIRVFAALARILLGSMFFALWGVSSARAWNVIPGQFWKAAAILPLALLLIVPLAGLMAGISAAVKAVSPNRH